MERVKIALSAMNNRVAPVFDTSSKIVVITIDGDKIVNEESIDLTQSTVFELIDRFQELKINELVCGAISRGLQYLIEQKDIEVTPFISGELEEVKKGWFKKELNKEEYIMPGCCGRRARGNGMGSGRMNMGKCTDTIGNRRVGAGLGRGCRMGFGPGAARELSSEQGKMLGRGLGRGRGLGFGYNIKQNNQNS